MAKLKSQGGISPELMEQAKAAMLEENLNYAEAQEPSKRSGAGYPSLGGFIDTHFNFGEGDSLDFSRCQRADGSYYGTGGQCRKGTPAGAKEEEPKKAKAKGGGGGDSGSGSNKGGGGGSDSGGKDGKDAKGGGGGGEATSADLKTKVSIDDPENGYDKKTLSLGDIKKRGVGNDSLDMLEDEVRAGSDLNDSQKAAAAKVLRDDHAALKSEIAKSDVSDKEMNTLLTGGPKATKQQFQTQDEIAGRKYDGTGGQARIYAKINRDMRKDMSELVNNESTYSSLISKVRAGKASAAEQEKYGRMFGWPHTDKTVDRTMANVAKVNKGRSK